MVVGGVKVVSEKQLIVGHQRFMFVASLRT
jgi:hypothetical protein